LENHENPHCLNCKTKIKGSYCHTCGQKSSTHRLDMKDFILHELVHGVFHFDKGILYTVKEIILRPGKVAKNYIDGKRVAYYNFFYLTLLLIALLLILKEILHNSTNPIAATPTDSYRIGAFVANKYFKYVFLSFIPLLVVAAKIMYRSARLNTAEHSIIAVTHVISFLLILVISNLFNIVCVFIHQEKWSSMNSVLMAVVFLNGIRIYYQVFNMYNKNRESNFLKAFGTMLFFHLLMFICLGLIFFLLPELGIEF
jgi:hypothetical protein